MSSETSTCHLCGLPAAGSNISRQIEGATVHFCCPGCMYVFEALFNNPDGFPRDYKNTELYRVCVSAGLIPSGAGTGDIAGPSAVETQPNFGTDAELTEVIEGLSRELSVRIEGMWCIACSWLIEQVIRKMDGVISAGIFFFSDIARIKYMPHRVQARQIVDAISRLGYRAIPVEQAVPSEESGRIATRLGISAILSMNIMMISAALYWGFFEEVGTEGAAYFSYALWVLATPVVFYGGWPILNRAFQGVLHLASTMDLLIASGALSAYGYSVVQMLRGDPHVYFDTASALITLVLLGRYIESRAREKISAGITVLFHAANTKARLIANGRRTWTSAEKVGPGDIVEVLRGERVPVDGLLLCEKALVDESVITGESLPVEKRRGSTVPAGALLLEPDIEIEAERGGGESSLSQILTLIQEALSAKNNIDLFADRAMRRLVPAVLGVAAATAVLLLFWSFPVGESLLRATAVLVITCPCTLGVAIPLARVAAVARARSSGILIRNPAIFEHSDRLGQIILDKTGTLTEGKYVLREIALNEGPRDARMENEALARVASAEVGSDHFLGRETLRAARDRGLALENVLSFESAQGLGIAATTGSGKVIAGNRRHMAQFGLNPPDGLDRRAQQTEAGGSTVVFFAWGGEVRGFLGFGDRARPGAAASVAALKDLGMTVGMVSGDSNDTTRAVALELGIENYTGQALPRDKVDAIARIQARGERVAMAGDGLNDAAALARADFGITVGTGANILRECADAAIFGDDPMKVPELLALSRLTFRIIRQNLFFAFFYNAIGVPLAALGFLNPLLAAMAMFASSLTVICNTLRISRFK